MGRCANDSRSGFTLVELMITVVILGILAAIAVVGYRRYIARARLGEPVAVLAEMNAKENIYKLEFAAYLPLRTDASPQPAPANEPVEAFYPISPSAAGFDSARTATAITNPALWPTAWRQVGLRPRDSFLYCTYFTNAGTGLTAGGDPIPGAAGQFGQSLLSMATASAPWFYSVAACNLNGVSGYPGEVTVLGMSSSSPTLRTFNDGL